MKRFLSFLLAVLIVCSTVPSVSAANDFTPKGYRSITRKTSTIAPGVTQDIVYTKLTANNEQMVYYLATADVTRDDVNVYANYKDNQWTNWGMQSVTEQMAAAHKNHSDPDSDRYIPYYNVVAGVNGDFYDMTTGQPSYAFAMEGNIINKSKGKGFFAVLESGKAVIGFNDADWENYMKPENGGPIVEAIGGYMNIIKDGTILRSEQNNDYNARTAVGVTAEGKVVMAVADGKQSPFSIGTNEWHMAEILKEAGCVNAIEIDGGGSTTFAARQEGADKVTVVNKPCDGSPRSVSSSLMIVSTFKPSNVFERAALTPEHDYVTPKSTVQVDAVGVSPAGTSAKIPDDAAWQLADSSFGTVSGSGDSGVFTSTGKAGDAVVQITSGGKVVGEATIHVVVPDKLTFRQEKMTVPYEKTVNLNVSAFYGDNEVVLKSGDVKFSMTDSTAGTIDGFNFTAADSGSGTTLTAVNAYDSSVTVKTVITLGRGSEVLFDFEDGKNDNFDLSWGAFNYYLPNSDVYVVNKSTGKVHSGEHALALNMDYSNSLESGYQLIGLKNKGEVIYRDGATSIGMWIYVPVEDISLWVRFVWAPYDILEDGTRNAVDETGQIIDGEIDGATGWVNLLDESGWHYISQDVSAHSGVAIRGGNYVLQFYISDRDGTQFGYYGLKHEKSGDYCNLNGNYTFYIDDITVDYSSAVDDREPPVFSELTYATTGMADAAAIAKDTVPTATDTFVNFAAKVTDKDKDNATGLDSSTAKAYVDGNEIPCTYNNGAISMDASQMLDNGVHTIKFSICDYQGNYGSIIRKINVNSEDGKSSVQVVAHDPNADRVPLGSVQYIDIVAPADREVKSVTTRLNLDSMNTWELNHMNVAEGYNAEWSMKGADAADRIATVTITRDKDEDITWTAGDHVLASLPVRVWDLTDPETVGDKTWTISEFVKAKEVWPIAVDVKVEQGEAVYTDGTKNGTFSGSGVRIWSELWGTNAYINLTAEGKTYWSNLEANGTHTHTATAMADKAATCLTPGYKNRTWCEACKSVVNWGTTVPATGHKWEIAPDGANKGKMRCTGCDKLYTGELEGKTYVDGAMLNGWVDDSYYVSGVKLTGIQQVPKPDAEEETLLWYLFDKNGVCGGRKPYTGEYEEKGYQDGVLHTGWLSNDCYYIDGVKQTGEFYEIDEKMYRFVDGVCKGQLPYTGFRTIKETVDGKETENRYYYEWGILQTGRWFTNSKGEQEYERWFQVQEEYCHACEGKGGALGKVTDNDNRTCVQAGYIFYNCSCGETKMSQALWEKGHQWDIENPQSGGPVPECTVCHKKGKDIGELKIEFDGKSFVYTGQPIPAAYVVKDGDKQLNILSDKRGLDGLASYSNHTNVGKGVLSISGRGDYYGTLTGEFTIIPGKIPEVRVKKRDQTSVTLEWDPAPGAEYYVVYQHLPTESSESSWIQVGEGVREREMEITGLTYGQTYEFRAASRVTNPGGSYYAGAGWTTVSVSMVHEWNDITVAEATCTEDGRKTQTCKHCGEVKVVEELPAPGHKVENWTTIEEATITEKGLQEGVCTVCEQTVREEIPTLTSYDITAAETENGTVIVSPKRAAEGEDVTVRAVPKAQYKLGEITVETAGGEKVEVSDAGDGSFTFTMPAEAVTVTVAFEAVPYAITVAPVQNGAITTEPSNEAPEGNTVTVTATPTEGYKLETLTVKTAAGGKGVEVSDAGDGSFTFTMPAEAVSISATFQRDIKSYTVAVAKSEHGTVSTDPAGRADEGSSVRVQVEPESGYDLNVLSVSYTEDGETKEAPVSDNVFLMPSANVTVSASFVRVDVNDDGSTTKTEIKPDGTTVETTTKTDDSVVVVETKNDGSKTITETDKDGNKGTVEVASDGSKTVDVILDDTAVKDATAPIVLPIPEITVAAKAEATITISVPDVPGTDEPVRVTVPVVEASSSAVAILVKADGTKEKILKNSILTKDGLTVTLEEDATIQIIDNSKNFKDVDSGNWAADAIAFASSHELFQGVGKKQFAPNAPMSRGMLITVLHRLEDTPVDGEVEFSDIPDGAWYADAVAWASKNKIVTGYGNGTYKPNDNVTREQLATILYRYAKNYKGLDTTAKAGNLNRFSDGSSTSGWAKQAMNWAVGIGLFKGSNKRLNPKGTATRAEAAALLQRFVKYMATTAK